MSEPKILVTRRIPDAGLEILEEKAEIEVYEGDAPISRGELIDRVKDKQGLLCLLSDKVDAEVMDSAPELKVISNYAVGFDNIDVDAATDRGIMVTNTPGALTEATADLTWALIMSAARRIPESDAFMRAGRYEGWGPKLLLGRDVYGKTIGIIGLGDIGSAVARRARGFDMRILYHSRHRKPEKEEELGAEYAELDDLIRESDFLSPHVPLTEGTRHLIGERELDMMKDAAILINVSRGEVIDEGALVSALEEGRIAYAGLDVYENEPEMAPGLANLPNTVLTPHTGSATYTARDEMAVMAANDIILGIQGKRPENLVNREVMGD
ncbi:MAG: 2-hydroxyacid dehydrogenase [Methanomassiliicoccales archaeon]